MTNTNPRCAKCGHKRSEHHYRHPFVDPSLDTTIAELEAERDALQAKLDRAIAQMQELSNYGVPMSPRLMINLRAAVDKLKGTNHDT